MLLWLVGATIGSLAVAQRASAMTVQAAPEGGFSIVFDLDFMDNVLRVTLPKSASGLLDAMSPSAPTADLLTLSHPLDTLEQVDVEFVPGRGLRVSFDSAGLPSGGDTPSTPGGDGGPTPPSGSVPEPGSAALLAMGVLGASWTRVRRRTASA